jgi:hypothetical protein
MRSSDPPTQTGGQPAAASLEDFALRTRQASHRPAVERILEQRPSILEKGFPQMRIWPPVRFQFTGLLPDRLAPQPHRHHGRRLPGPDCRTGQMEAIGSGASVLTGALVEDKRLLIVSHHGHRIPIAGGW